MQALWLRHFPPPVVAALLRSPPGSNAGSDGSDATPPPPSVCPSLPSLYFRTFNTNLLANPWLLLEQQVAARTSTGSDGVPGRGKTPWLAPNGGHVWCWEGGEPQGLSLPGGEPPPMPPPPRPPFRRQVGIASTARTACAAPSVCMPHQMPACCPLMLWLAVCRPATLPPPTAGPPPVAGPRRRGLQRRLGRLVVLVPRGRPGRGAGGAARHAPPRRPRPAGYLTTFCLRGESRSSSSVCSSSHPAKPSTQLPHPILHTQVQVWVAGRWDCPTGTYQARVALDDGLCPVPAGILERERAPASEK